MKWIICLCLASSGYCVAQENEFKTYPNGLIYDVSTMHKLGIIIDSLNIKFRTCDLAHPYYSFPQGFANFVRVPSKAARQLINSGVSFEVYEKSYPRQIEHVNMWVVKSSYTDYEGGKRIEYSGLPHGWHAERSITVDDTRTNDKTSGWIINEDGTEAIFLKKIERFEIPNAYARKVQYVDCMIDTSSTIYFAQAKKSYFSQAGKDSKAYMFCTWAESYPGKPEYPENKAGEFNEAAYQNFRNKFTLWDSLRLLNLDKQMANDRDRKRQLMQAKNEAVAKGDTDSRLTFYVQRYLSKADALALMRSYKVVGFCSMDEGPRLHAMNICKLAAETTQWDIFLRSHLDIMNDYFERMSDGSYAWAGRKTYLKELEALDINAIDLLIGISLRVENVDNNHYHGSIARVGRALSDAEDKDKLESVLTTMIRDGKLDLYNRLLIAYLYRNYVHNLEDGERKTLSNQKLETAMLTMPPEVLKNWKKD